ncbi:MAG: aminoacyl-tRNA hydrolase [Firmicutes bacterium]|nr:aminoacyl-tRNA hydrolase [Bacillota bacterium]
MLVVGLGNPGIKYALSRHNIGFWVIDELVRRHGKKIKNHRCQAVCQEIELSGKKVVLAQPLTFMNRSGLAVKGLADYYGIAAENILIIYDDLDLEPGRIRLRPKGGSGGHRGCASVIFHLRTEDFPRLRIGIGRPAEGQEAADYVLSHFSPEEEPLIAAAVEKAADAVLSWVEEGIEVAMNRFNVRETKG